MINNYLRLPVTSTNLKWFPVFLILYNFTANLSNDIYMPSMPHLVQVFGSSSSVIQLTMGVWFAGVALPQLFFGAIADRFGRKFLLVVGAIVFISATLLCSVADTIWLLLLGRFLQGVGVCSLNVVSFTVLREAFDYQQSVKWLSHTNIISSIAPLTGPIIGGHIFIWFGWRMNFILVFLVGVTSLVGLWFLMPESLQEADRQALSPKILIKNYAALLSNWYFMRHVLTYSLLLGGTIAYLTSSAFLIIKHYNIAPNIYGYTQLPIFTVYIIGVFIAKRAITKYGSQCIIKVGLGILTVSIAMMLVFGIAKLGNTVIFVTTMCGYTFGYSFASGPITIEALSSTQVNRGCAAAILGLSMSLACMLGSLLISVIFNGTLLSVALVIVTLVVAALTIFLNERQTVTI